MSILPPQKKNAKKPFPFINKNVDKKGLNKLLSKVYEEFGTAKTGQLANSLKDLGFSYATKAGVTISISDLDVPAGKKELLAETEADLEKSNQRFISGDITEVERYTKVIDTWSQTTETLTKQIVEKFDRMNPVYMMAFSGARGNISQVRQLVGMRGLMADAQGQIIDFPIKSNFREGLSVTEYIISSYGARKGLVDTALKTADSGYLTRRLVDVAQDVIIQEEDCGTDNGLYMEAIIEGDSVIVSLSERVISRTASENVSNDDGEILIPANEMITPTMAQAVEDAGLKQVKVRSALTCITENGICQKCYGWSLTNNHPVDLGEAIGIMAAQSIGEPGTQLTMRTFHTGGVFSGGGSMEQFIARNDGEVIKEPPTKEFRSRHGDIVQVTTKDAALEIKVGSKNEKYNLPFNTFLHVKKGDKVKAGDILGEFEPIKNRRTERATKDINSDLSGEVLFSDFDADEKRDRQGNVSRTANKAGTIWMIGGDVYTLPTGAKNLIKNGDELKEGAIIAETMVTSEHGGEVRIPDDLVTKEVKSGKEKVQIIEDGKNLTIVIASIQPSNADLKQTKKEQLWKVQGGKETYIVKSPEGTSVENGSVIAELIDETTSAPTSGQIRYEDIEIDDQRILSKPGKLIFIPEEIHQVSKDISLKVPGIETGSKVKAGTEIIKGVTCQTDGIVDITEENDIIREVVIRPGELYRVDDTSKIDVEDGTIVDKGVEVAPGVKTKKRCVVTINFRIDDPEEGDVNDVEDTSDLEYAEVLLRPFEEFEVGPRKVNIKFDSTDTEHMEVVPITQLQVKDGDRIRQIEGAPLLRTSLVLQMKGYLERLKGVAEIDAGGKGKKEDGNLKVVVLENLTIRRDAPSAGVTARTGTQTQLLVKDRQMIDKKAPVVKTQVIAQTKGFVSLGSAQGEKEVRRVLIITDDHETTVKTATKAKLKKGDLVKLGDTLCKGTTAPVSGMVTKVTDKSVVIREGRPYLISAGTLLQVPDGALAQQGDLIASIIFERQKTGDIVQGLPRVEELLEGRKPKEHAIISPVDATVEIEYEDGIPAVFLNYKDGREEVSLPVGISPMVDHKQEIKAGQPITDGPINPHDILEVTGVESVRRYLVDEVQRVYRSQGVEIADKHIEVIVRQMTKKVRVDDSGDTTLLAGELVDQRVVTAANAELKGKKKEPATCHAVLLGITKASLNTDSFISAASFQETTRVLAEASVEGKRDFLRGLKENVIIGRLIPAGTGFPNFKDVRGETRPEEGAYTTKSTLRKPSAILEEIESMFGSPEMTEGTLENIILDDSNVNVDKKGQDAILDDE